jgi:chemotaxis protein MotA
MRFLIGVLIISFGFIAASIHLDQGIMSYWDFVAFFVVLFGTFSVMFMNRPKVSFKKTVKYSLQSIFRSGTQKKNFVQDCVGIAAQSKDIPEKNNIEYQILRDGLELLSLGFSYEKIESILTQRFHSYSKNINNISSWLRKNAKYPPAFGLAGTVLGLIHLMRGISDGITTQETGIRMAVALVATFYGIIIANIFLNPTGEMVQEELKAEEEKAEIAIHTVQLIFKNASAIEVQEELNSYIESNEKINLLAGISFEDAA